MAVAAGAAVPALYGIAGFVFTTGSWLAGIPGREFLPDTPSPWAPDGMFVPLTGVAGTVVCVWARRSGRRLLAAGRQQVLFLRRFGYAPATSIVTRAVSQVGGDWRVVTLDDQRTVPVGPLHGAGRAVAAWSRLVNFFRSGQGVALALAAMAIACAGVNALDAFAAVPAGLVLAVALLLPVAAFVSGELTSARRASRSRLAVRSALGVGDLAERTSAHARTAFGPGLMVVDVLDATVWRSVVVAFAQRSSAALIDVSLPSAQVFWEIELLTTELPRPCVFVAERSRAEALAASIATDPDAARLDELLAGRPVLTYDAGAKEAFVTALRATLEATAAAPGPRVTPRIDLPNEADDATITEPAVRARLVGIVTDMLAHYEQATPQRTRRNGIVNRRVTSRFPDGTKREITTYKWDDPGSDGRRNPRPARQKGDVETTVTLPRKLTDRDGRRIVVVAAEPDRRYELRLVPIVGHVKPGSGRTSRFGAATPITQIGTLHWPDRTLEITMREIPVAHTQRDVVIASRAADDLERSYRLLRTGAPAAA